ncbi:heavy-metal-associated domain-containing protein [Variovorax boronicumulans]|uniref:heavy-metal-associated domain-containing protein n=1 Tax=Variovorax boronicumulans TaxID=436515 RepID=UPI001C59D750
MISIEVKDMTCGHCASALRQAIAAIDVGATVKIDLAARLLHIDSAVADAPALIEAVRAAGYDPQPVDWGAEDAPARSGGACCGG